MDSNDSESGSLAAIWAKIFRRFTIFPPVDIKHCFWCYLPRLSGLKAIKYLWIWPNYCSQWVNCLLETFCDIPRSDHGCSRGLAGTLHFISG